MSKTLNSKIAYFIHHLKPSSDIFAKKSKYKFDLKDVPQNLKNKVELLEHKCALSRYGNQRKDVAKSKVHNRKKLRHQNDHLLQEELKNFSFN